MTIIKDAMNEPITLTLKTGELITIPARGEKKVKDSSISDMILKARDNGLVTLFKEETKPLVKAKKSIKNGGINDEL